MCLIHYLLVIYWIILLARVLTSWFPMPMSGPGRRFLQLLYAVTEPVLRPLRGLLPAIRLRAAALDVSPILLFIVLSILINAITC